HGRVVRARRPSRARARLRRPEPARLDRHAGRRRPHRRAGGPLPRRSRLRAVRPRLSGDRPGVRARLPADARSQGPRASRHRLRHARARRPRALVHRHSSGSRRRLQRSAPLNPERRFIMTDAEYLAMQNSTIVRSRKPSRLLPLARAGNRALSALAPSLAAGLAERLFLTPPRPHWPPSEIAQLSSARARPLQVGRRHVDVWLWGTGPSVLLVHGWGGRGAQ